MTDLSPDSVSLYSLASWTNGMAFRSIEFSDVGRPIIKISEVKNGLSGQTKFTEAEYDPKYRIRSGDMVFCWSGQPETSIGTYYWRGPDGWLNQHLFRVEPRSEAVSDDFFYYLLQDLNPRFVELARNKQTTGLGHVTKRDLQDIRLDLPPLEEQRRIASVLRVVDDLIDANRQMQRWTSELITALYKQLMLAGGSADLPLLEAYEVRFGAPFGGAFFTEPGVGVPLLRIRDIKSQKSDVWTTEERADAVTVNAGDVVFGMDAEFRPSWWLGPPSLLNQRVGWARSRLGGLAYTRESLAGPLREIESYKTGTTVIHLNKRDLATVMVSTPGEQALGAFDEIADPLLDLVVGLTQENTLLQGARDELLPLLMSGRVRVGEVAV